MSGEGGPLPSRPAAPADRATKARAAERGDVLAYLRRRQRNAGTVAETMMHEPELAALARDRAQQLAVVIQDIGTGLHFGEAEVERALAEKENSDGR